MGRRRMMKVRGMTVTAIRRESPHCWTVSPPKAQQLKYLLRKKMMQNSKRVMKTNITQKMQLLSRPLKMSSSSLIFRQLKKLKICRKTKTLKTKVRCREQTWYFSKEPQKESPLRGCSSPLTIVPSACPWKYLAPRSVPMTWSNPSANSGRNYCPLRTRKRRRAIWQTDWMRMCLIMVRVISESDRFTGRCLSIFSVLGGSVERAREARLSMIMFTHSICTVVKTDCLKMEEEMMLKTQATTLTVSWNCRNFLMDSQMFLPQTMDRTMELKLSSRMRMSEAFFATWVPEMPMATPTLALRRAGASLVPSPVTATTLLSLFRPSTKRSLCYGLLLERILRCFTFSQNSLGVRLVYSFQNSSPSMQRPTVLSSARVMPIQLPTARAVTELSPVTMMTTTPARLHWAMASLLSGRRRSWMPASSRRVKPLRSISLTPNLSLVSTSAAEGSFSTSFTPKPTTLSPRLVRLASSSSTAARSRGTMPLAWGALLYILSQALKTISLPPVRNNTFLLRQLMPVVIRLRSELKGNLRNIFSQFWHRSWKRSFPAQNQSAYLSNAISVADPLGLGFKMEEELVAMEVQTRSLYQSPLGWLAKGERVMLFQLVRQLLPFHTSTTFMLFCVNVPVLSVQITWAEPIVSQQASFFTRFFSSNICLTEKARERVTARGRPSGTATTMSVTASMRQLRMLAMCLLESNPWGTMSVMNSQISSTRKRMAPEMSPNQPIFSAKSSSFSSRGVHSSTSSWMSSLSSPWRWSLPVRRQSMSPSPLMILEPLMMTGEGAFLLSTPWAMHLSRMSLQSSWASPVIELSSTMRSFARIARPSTGISKPEVIRRISPTTISSLKISRYLPSRKTSNLLLRSEISLSSSNCFCFWTSLTVATIEQTATAARMVTPSSQKVCRSQLQMASVTMETTAAPIRI